MRTGVFLPNWIGDVAMATPALRALRKLVDADGGELVAVMRPYVGEVLDGLGWFDDAVPLRRQGDANRLRSAKLDRVVLLTNSLRTAWLAWRSGARERVGYRGDFRSLLLTKAVKPIGWGGKEGTPPIDSYRYLAYTIGAEPEPPTLQLATTPADEQAADEIWRGLALPEGDRVVVLNTGGAFGAAKSWPVEHFAALARRIVGDGYSVLVNCGPAERDAAREITRQAGSNRVQSLADWPSSDSWSVPIGVSKAVIRRSRLLVSTDSGPRFFGIAFGKPVVSLFGPTGPRATRTYSRLERPLSLSLDCQPCMEATCPLKHHRCMRDLSVDRVMAAVTELLATTRPAIRQAS